MAGRARPLMLEDWLCACASPESPQASSLETLTAREVAQAWSAVRDGVAQGLMESSQLTALEKLAACRLTLHVAEPQARLLLKLLLQKQGSLLGRSRARALVSLIISTWIRKLAKPQPSLKPLLESIAEATIDTASRADASFSPEFILLLGSLSSVPMVSLNLQTICHRKVAELLNREGSIVMSANDGGIGIARALAGAGYALYSSSQVSVFRSIFVPLLGIWNEPAVCINGGIMLLHLAEWLTIQQNLVAEKMNVMADELLEAANNGSFSLSFSATMASGGILRSINRQKSAGMQKLKQYLEAVVAIVAERIAGAFNSDKVVRCVFDSSAGFEFDSATRSLLQCVAMAVSRCGGNVAFNPSILLCLGFTLFVEAFPLREIYSPIVTNSLDITELNKISSSLIFQESGSLTRAMCHHYCLAPIDLKQLVQQLVWQFSEHLYRRHRIFMISLGKVEKSQRFHEKLDNITKAIFFAVVVFFSTATKHISSLLEARALVEEISVLTLDSLSCIECFRREQVADYKDMIKNVISCVSQSTEACESLRKMIPPYHELLQCLDSSNTTFPDYCWYEDNVQTARVYFYLRILAPCVLKIQEEAFADEIAPLMFLYMQHTNQNVVKASHGVFVAFISAKQSDYDFSQVDRNMKISPREQLVVYYMQRALEGYPHLTPFEALSSGVVALVEHLPAGSPAIHFCAGSLERKLRCMYDIRSKSRLGKEDEQEESQSLKNLQALLLNLIVVADIQVLTDLLKLIAQLIIEMPDSARNAALGDLFDIVTASDDVVRKPTLVPWLQSLSYLSLVKGTRVNKFHDRQESSDAVRGKVERSPNNVRNLVSPPLNHSRL